MAGTRILVAALPTEHALAGAAWITVPTKVQVSKEGRIAKQYAWELVNKLRLVPKSGAQVPGRIMNHRKLPSQVKSAVRYILERGYWNPTILPLKGEPKKGFEIEERSYSRMFLFGYSPVQDAFVLQRDDLDGLFLWSPRDLNQKQETDYPENDRHIFRMAKELHGRFCGSKSDRHVVSSGSLGKAVYNWHADSVLDAAWLRTMTSQDEAFKLEVGDTLPRAVITEHPEHSYSEFKWLPQFSHGVIQLEDPTKVYPRIKISPDDFPESVKELHQEFFDGWKG